MQNRDNLEKFIKNEVDRIEFDDADSLWQEFKVQLQKEEPKSKQRKKIFIIFFIFLTCFVSGGFFLSYTLNQEKIADFSNDEENSTNINESPLSQNQVKNDKGQFSTTHTKIEDYDFGQLERTTSHNQKRQLNETTSDTKSKIIDYNNEESSIGIRGSSFESDALGFIKAKSNVGIHQGISGNRNFYIYNKKLNLTEITEKIISGRYTENKRIQGTVVPNQLQEEGLGELHKQASAGEVNSQEKMEKSTLLLERIQLSEIKERWLDDPVNNLFQADLQYETRNGSRKNLFLSLESSFAANSIQQYAFGIGKYFFLNDNSGIKVQGGASLDNGLSFSQDSVFVRNGLSIVETRRDRDLQNLWNANLGLGFYQMKNKWKFGIGLRGGYSIINQFYLTEHTRTTHLGTFYNLKGTTNYQKVKSSSWDGINRINFQTYLEINYQIGTDYSIGISVIKRLNRLISKDMANQAYSNRPIRVGLSLSKFF